MHPGFFGWRRRHHGEGHGPDHCGPGGGPDGGGRGGPHFGPGHGPPFGPGDHPGFGPGFGPPGWFAGPGGHGHGHGDEGGGFGVRRPLRFLANKLDLEEDQVTSLAAVLNDLKTERAQAEVDQRRRIAALADVLEGSAFDDAKIDAAGAEQSKSQDRVKEAVKTALKKIHALLTDEQRKRFAYLLRTGVLVL